VATFEVVTVLCRITGVSGGISCRGRIVLGNTGEITSLTMMYEDISLNEFVVNERLDTM
jgi:hypothetical protein